MSAYHLYRYEVLDRLRAMEPMLCSAQCREWSKAILHFTAVCFLGGISPETVAKLAYALMTGQVDRLVYGIRFDDQQE